MLFLQLLEVMKKRAKPRALSYLEGFLDGEQKCPGKGAACGFFKVRDEFSMSMPF